MICLKSVSEFFSLKIHKENSILEKSVCALNDISLTINKGEVCNIIGENGAGKTTLLKVITGIIEPSLGKVNVDGRVGVIMDIGCGFHPDLTGRENILASASIYGIDRDYLKTKMKAIEDFAELKDFFDAPIRTYSQGMYLRLAFSFAVNFDPDILCIDDIIAVGDEKAKFKCIEKIEELRDKQKTILLVTHDLSFARKFSKRTVWLKNGAVYRDGNSDSVITEYIEHHKNDYSSDKKIYSCPLRFNFNHQNKTTFMLYRHYELVMLESVYCELIQLNENRIFRKQSLEIIESNIDFIKIKLNFDIDFFWLDLVINTKEDKFNIECFINDKKKYLKGNFRFLFGIPWLVTWDSFDEIKQDYEDLRNEKLLISWNSSKHLGFRAQINPGNIRVCLIGNTLHLESEFDISCENSLFRSFCLKGAIVRNQIKADVFINELLLKDKKQKIFSDTLECRFIDKGFSLKYDNKELLCFRGIELLFEIDGKTFSSTDSFIKMINGNAHAGTLNLKITNEAWPCYFFMVIALDNNVCTIKTKIKKIIDCEVDKFRIQILWKEGSVIKSGNINNINKPLSISLEDVFIKICSKLDKCWIAGHRFSEDNINALVTYVMIPKFSEFEENDLTVRFSKTCESMEMKINEYPEKSGFDFVDGCLNLFCKNEKLFPLGHYISFYISSAWHDSMQCLWEKKGENSWEGLFPWIPVKLFCDINFKEEYIMEIIWRYECLRDVWIDRYQLCFQLSEKFKRVSVNDSFESLDDIRKLLKKDSSIRLAYRNNDNLIFEAMKGVLNISCGDSNLNYIQTIEKFGEYDISYNLTNFREKPESVSAINNPGHFILTYKPKS
ncbi:MAG: hypothetical protein ACD_79C00871G0001 [uncultured bacterium]|nr:MAG: hypothetical protein ACD_79C00871G0001 [uncultured bacterium]